MRLRPRLDIKREMDLKAAKNLILTWKCLDGICITGHSESDAKNVKFKLVNIFLNPCIPIDIVKIP